MPIMAMGLAIREHIKQTATGRARTWGVFGASMAAGWLIHLFGQIVGNGQSAGLF